MMNSRADLTFWSLREYTELQRAERIAEVTLAIVRIQQIMLGRLPELRAFTIDDMREAFQGGRDSVEAEMGCEQFGDMESYAKKKIIKTFKQWMHEYKQNK